MDVITLLIAVSFSMFMFSCLSSMLVELMNRYGNKRKIQFDNMIHEFYENELKPLVTYPLEDGFNDVVAKIHGKHGKDHISTNDFLCTLASTNIGQKIYQRLDGDVDDLISEIAMRFEDVGERYSEYFKKNAQRVNQWVSIFLALVLNINVITIIQTVSDNSELQATLVTEAQKIVDKLETTKNKNVNTEEAQNTLNEKLNEINQLGIPYGWPLVPKNTYENDSLGIKEYVYNVKDSIAKGLKDFSLGWGVWLFSTIATGLLIGLGASFWFDIVKRLVHVNRYTGAILGTTTKDQSVTKDTVDADTPQEVFKKAIKGKQAANKLVNNLRLEPINPVIKL